MTPGITVSAGADAITTGAKAGSGPGERPRGFVLPLLGDGHRGGSGAGRPAGAVPTASCSLSFNSSRACRRQPNNCCGLSPCRRATSDTLAPGFRLSTTIRALSSADHCRRRDDVQNLSRNFLRGWWPHGSGRLVVYEAIEPTEEEATNERG